MKRGTFFLMTCFLSLWLLMAGTAECNQLGKLTILLSDLGADSNKEAVRFQLYRVATLDKTGKWVLVDELSGKGIDLNTAKYAEDWDNLALKLEYLTERRDMQFETASSDSTSEVEFTGLWRGMYLAVPRDTDEYGEISPFLTAIPMQEENEEIWEVTVDPKSESLETKDREIQVKKEIGYFDPEGLETVSLVAEDATYYIGIFEDGNGEIPAVSDYIHEISITNGSSGETTFEGLGEGNYYIFETDSDGNSFPMWETQQKDGAEFVCFVKSSTSGTAFVQLNQETKGEVISLYNMYYDVPSSTYVVDTDSQDTGSSSYLFNNADQNNGTSSQTEAGTSVSRMLQTRAPKTGDVIRIMCWVMLALCSVLLLLLLIRRGRERRR